MSAWLRPTPLGLARFHSRASRIIHSSDRSHERPPYRSFRLISVGLPKNHRPARLCPMPTRISGTYVLILDADRAIEVGVGALGRVTLPAGHYLYVGSALSGLWQRLQRHLDPAKRHHWHIDYLLDAMPIIEVWYREGKERVECTWARALAASTHLEPFDGIGASDCACPTHLFRSENMPRLAWFAGNPAFEGITSWTPTNRANHQGASDGWD
jgi:Uri superfamily endonuclease